jgi:hypothetical protein
MNSIIITVQDRKLRLQDGDEIYVEKRMCGRCDSEHTKITVTRNSKEIAHLGDEFTTAKQEDEVYGGVVVDKDGSALPDPHWRLHIIPSTHPNKWDAEGMTKDGMYYIGLCGTVLDHSTSLEHDMITFPSNMSTMREKDKERLCKECREVYENNTLDVNRV